MMRKKVGWPIIVLACAGLVGLLFFMGKTFLAEPVSIHTAPPPWIDAKTGKPKMTGGGSGKPAAKPSGDPAGSGQTKGSGAP